LVGDGDPHTLIRPDTIRPSTATELLEHILARDHTPRSVSTLLREQQDPALRLGDSVERYIDALHLAAEEVVGSSAVQALEGSANQWVPGLTDESAWPTLRAHLLLLAVGGAEPHERLRAVYDAGSRGKGRSASAPTTTRTGVPRTCSPPSTGTGGGSREEEILLKELNPREHTILELLPSHLSYLVARSWVYAVRDSMAAIKTESERRAHA
jgi:hypothetical protein